MSSPAALTGHCFCGFVHYRATGPVSNETVCHCSMCRRVSGAPMVAWITVPRASLRFTAGAPATFRSSARATRGFCPRCGTALTFASDDFPDEVDLTTCSLADPEALPPRDHTRTSSRLRWVQLADGLPSFPETRPG